MQGVNIHISAKYYIEVSNEYASDFWEILTENFNVILAKRQHSLNGTDCHISIIITDIKTTL